MKLRLLFFCAVFIDVCIYYYLIILCCYWPNVSVPPPRQMLKGKRICELTVQTGRDGGKEASDKIRLELRKE